VGALYWWFILLYMARNRYNSLREQAYNINTKECIFISHQKGDLKVAKRIADYIIRAGIDVYFDEYDESINLKDPRSVVDAIKAGIRNSTRMLCILTENSMHSKWMPWEIGYGYERTTIIGLTGKDIARKVLPEYLQIVPIIKGTRSLNKQLAKLIGKDESHLIFERKMFSTTDLRHPLDGILERQL